MYILQDLLKHNDYQRLSEQRKQEVKTLFKGYKSMSATMRQALQKLGFEISEDGAHYKLTYGGDLRYRTTIAKTGSGSPGRQEYRRRDRQDDAIGGK